uniref:Uncharacterized protein n=1 Tax=Tetranychus urticae TaxID=32264 RepID=T1JR82_TETUR
MELSCLSSDIDQIVYHEAKDFTAGYFKHLRFYQPNGNNINFDFTILVKINEPY